MHKRRSLLGIPSMEGLGPGACNMLGKGKPQILYVWIATKINCILDNLLDDLFRRAIEAGCLVPEVVQV